MHTAPPAPTFVVTAFATVEPGAKFTFDVFGRGVPHGYTVTNPPARLPVDVTFNVTAVASAGTPPRFATTNDVVTPALRMPSSANCPSTVAAASAWAGTSAPARASARTSPASRRERSAVSVKGDQGLSMIFIWA